MKINFKFSLKYFIFWLAIILLFNYKLFLGIKDIKEEGTSKMIALNVARWDLQNSIEVVGSAELVDEQSLWFNIAWTVTKVNVKAWDKVKKWDIIAEIDNTDAYNNIRDAQISLENARISLDQLYKWPDDSQIMSSKNAITNAENALSTAEKELENLKINQKNTIDKQLEDIQNSKKELESSKSTLELAKRDLEILIQEKWQNLDNTLSNKNTTIKNTEDSFKTYIVEIERLILEADYILWVSEENSTKNDSFEIYLWAKNSAYKSKASSLLLNLIAEFDVLEKKVNAYDYSWDIDEIILILKDFEKIYNDLYEMEDALFRTWENSIVSDNFTQAQIDAIKNNATSAKNTALSRKNSINSTINTLNTLSDTDLISSSNQNAIATKQESIKAQEISIVKQEANVANSEKIYEETLASQKVALKNKENDLAAKKDSLEVAKKSYEELIEWPTAENVKKQQNAIKQAEIRVENATKNLEDYRLEAPFDGIVRKIDYMVWDNLKNDTDKYVYLENPDLVEITVKLDQIDIVSVNLDNDAIITFDAYPNNPAKAKISLIDTTPVMNAWVVSYEVKLVLDDWTFNKSLLSWMTANVEIITEKKEDVLLLKTQAITTKGNKKFVKILKQDDETFEQEVLTGISQDWETEIISWLTEDDIVVYEKVTFAVDTTWMQWMWWWPWGGGMMIAH